MDWIWANKEWLFGGIGIAIPIAIIGWWLQSRTGNKQVQKGGDASTNIQVGRDFKVNRKNSDD